MCTSCNVCVDYEIVTVCVCINVTVDIVISNVHDVIMSNYQTVLACGMMITSN